MLIFYQQMLFVGVEDWYRCMFYDALMFIERKSSRTLRCGFLTKADLGNTSIKQNAYDIFPKVKRYE